MTTSFIWNMAKKSFTMNTSSSASKMIVMATSRGSIPATDADQTTGQGEKINTLWNQTRKENTRGIGKGGAVVV